ncbi:MAG: hypothetical protein A2X61_11170 [Ignavibacteria bacterium GWB2_35_12]|nr:MAG: hypothetical protein A2X61_11170 [Ignavibacteria bacterium GWB2_35_12]OGU86621.1 MAG: hypothetical protein A2220_02505 [Ignavibacteria bacterium RIFOXYA2_FULL_35_10]OGV23997.1 MAG: hypothetical protein A2475_10815 [Ignavibacteria bacterium RIFOXYC2_FULL_35_21]
MKYLGILTVVIFVAIFSLSFRNETSIIDHPIIEDAYYTFSVAKNIAHGNGISADGENLTNGFQPLYTFLIVPAFAITNNDYLSVRIIFIFLVLLFTASAFLFASIIRDTFSELLKIGKKELYWISFFIYLSSTLFFKNQLNGLETGLIFFLLLAFIRYYQKIDKFNYKNIIILGVLQGLLVITRIDSVFLVIIFFIFILTKKEMAFKNRLIFALLSGLIAFIISLPWWWYNYHYFNSIMPSSGRSQFGYDFKIHRIFNILSAIAQNLVPDTYTFDRVIVGWGGIFARFGLVIFIILFLKIKLPGLIKKLSDNNRMNYRFLEILYVVTLFSIVLIFWYFLFSSASHFYHRYLCSITLIGQILTVIFISYLFVNKKIFYYSLTSLLAMALVIITVTLHSGKLMNKSQFYKYQLPLVMKYVPETEFVSASQSGTLGFFRKKVLNLDGKVNNDVLKYNKRIPEYLSLKKVKWFCDWKFFAELNLGNNPEKAGWKLIHRYGDFNLYHKSSE